MDDLITEFITETNEGLEELGQDMVKLEQNPNDNELLEKIFRLVHTIKGTCGFLGLPRLEKVAHHAENVLGRFRDGDLDVKAEYVTLIFDSLDQITQIIAGVEETGSEPKGDDSALIARLDAVYEGRDNDETAPESPALQPPEEDVPASETREGSLTEDTIGIVSEAELEAAFQAAEVLPVEDIKAQVIEEKGFDPEEEAKKAAKITEDRKKEAAAFAASTGTVATQQTLRVNVDVLENLMAMVSELVLTRNQLLQILRAQADNDFVAPLQRLNQIVSELQEGVMQTRMQPIGNAWSKLPRIIRDLALELDKKIDLVMEGRETELDRQVLELIKDPLTHMVRNSADHGIEIPADREMAGKPEIGTILLKAYHEGGHIIIEIADDGKGLSIDKIKQKIIANALATEDELAQMSTQQIQQYIFKAGFSTAEHVTSVSGRGVGMDVVNTNIEKIGGSIELNSEEGKGSTFTIKIPLTLAIVSALIVESGKERFAIPQLSVRELVMSVQGGKSMVEMINGTPVFRLRNTLLPLVPLDELLKLRTNQLEDQIESLSTTLNDDEDVATSEIEPTKQPCYAHARYIVVTEVGSYQFGILVDRVFDTEEIVVKPVANIPKTLRSLRVTRSWRWQRGHDPRPKRHCPYDR